ncbi:unnamed protein product [Acanthosepion pharaonis]|uniref:Integrase catalytic domain-containing protein n=1 Tax=Acanthosepion pharaonis TaxID=158019 RepID=A0A812D885_ACAPH|nr:unnamed protein product [Sepia pharaonis]
MSPLPAAPWTEVSADFGHLQNGKYLLVVTDEYSRYVVVDILDSISTTSVIPRLDKIFAEFGVPVSLKTDNGPPFNSSDFKDYASITGFKHRKITPLWPQANAETGRFMRTVKKSIKAALIKGRSWKQELFKFLLDYRTTPHCTTGVPPASVLFVWTIKNRLPHSITPIAGDPSIRERDTQAKTTMKRHADRKTYVKPNDLRVGDTVIIKNDHTSKALTPYQPNLMTVTKKKGSMITATHEELPSCDLSRLSYQGRTEYTSAVCVDSLSSQAPTRSLHKGRHLGIDWTSNIAVSFSLPPSCRLET